MQEAILRSHVLVLNKFYAPINLLPVRKAMKKLLSGRVEAVYVNEYGAYESYDFKSWAELSAYKDIFEGINHPFESVQTGSLTLFAPQVVRTLYYDDLRERILHPTRQNIYDRDNRTCQYCGKQKSTKDLNLDHVIPECQGGGRSWENLVCSCIRCNSKKAGRRPEEAGMKLIKRPVGPPPSRGFVPSPSTKGYKDWENFCSWAYWNTPLEG